MSQQSKELKIRSEKMPLNTAVIYHNKRDSADECYTPYYRLPDKDGNYLCYLECGSVCQSTFDSTIASEGEEFPFGEWVGVYNSDTHGFTDSYWEEYDAITHWMPMPEPPTND